MDSDNHFDTNYLENEEMNPMRTTLSILAFFILTVGKGLGQEPEKYTLAKTIDFPSLINGRTVNVPILAGSPVVLTATNGDKVLAVFSPTSQCWINKTDIIPPTIYILRKSVNLPTWVRGRITGTTSLNAGTPVTAPSNIVVTEGAIQVSVTKNGDFIWVSHSSHEGWITNAGGWVHKNDLISAGTDGKPIPPAENSTFLLNFDNWNNPEEFRKWEVYSDTLDLMIYRNQAESKTFGCLTEETKAHVTKDGVKRIEITYLEPAFYDPDLQKHKGQMPYTLRKQFLADLKKTGESLRNCLEQTFGPGTKKTIGKAQRIKQPVTEFQAKDLVLRLITEAEAVQIIVIRSENAKDDLLEDSAIPALPTPIPTPTPKPSFWDTPPTQPSKSALRREEIKLSAALRKAHIQENVHTYPNGDVIIDNIPMTNQEGRPYCATATLTMVANYFQVDINLNTLSDKLQNLDTAFFGIASEGKLDVTSIDKFDWQFTPKKAMELIDQGIPIIVWRKWSGERNGFHQQFAEKYRQDPSLQLPPASSDRHNWPTKDYCHASILTGYNAQRGEFLVTESWGEKARNRRMRIEEIQATAKRMIIFMPSQDPAKNTGQFQRTIP